MYYDQSNSLREFHKACVVAKFSVVERRVHAQLLVISFFSRRVFVFEISAGRYGNTVDQLRVKRQISIRLL